MSNLDAILGRKYRLESSENFDKYTKAIGVDGVLRKVATTLHPTVHLTKSGHEYVLTSSLPFKKIEVRFRPGIEFDQETPDGREVKTVFTFEEMTLHEVQTDDNGKRTSIDRTFSENEINVVLKVDDVVCTRIYRKEKEPYY